MHYVDLLVISTLSIRLACCSSKTRRVRKRFVSGYVLYPGKCQSSALQQLWQSGRNEGKGSSAALSGACPECWAPANATGSMPVSGTSVAKGIGLRESAGPQAPTDLNQLLQNYRQTWLSRWKRKKPTASQQQFLMDANCHRLMGGSCFEHTWAVSTSLFNAFSSPSLCLGGFHVACPIQPAGHSVSAKVPWLRGLRSPYRQFWIIIEIAAAAGHFRFAVVQQPEHWWETFLKIYLVHLIGSAHWMSGWSFLNCVAHNVKRKGQIINFKLKILLKSTASLLFGFP